MARMLPLVLTFFSLLFNNLPAEEILTGKAVDVIDGDTIKLENGTKIRYIGIDTPETKHPSKPIQLFGKEATEANKKLVLGKTVRVYKDVQDKDQYGRMLGYVYVDTIFVNLKLVEEGFAKVSTYPPNVMFTTMFVEAQKKAREEKRGLWSLPIEEEKRDHIASKEKLQALSNSGNANEVLTKKSDATAAETTVYVTNTGKKYHRGGCRYLSKSKIPMKLSSAIVSYSACKVCKPGGVSISTSSSKSSSTTTYSGRCQATTKKGTQCKRKAQSGRSYCWQH